MSFTRTRTRHRSVESASPERLARDAAIAAAYGTGETSREIAGRLGLSGPGVVLGVWAREQRAGTIEPLPRAMLDYRRRVALRMRRVG